jgi:hypothetical protein
MIKEYRDLRKAKAGRSEFNYSSFFALQEAKLSQSRMVFMLSRAMRLTQQANFRQNRRLPKPRLLAVEPEELEMDCLSGCNANADRRGAYSG